MDEIISLLIERIGKSSVLEFSNTHGLKHQTVRQWISGQRKINIDGMRLLAKAFPGDRQIRRALRAYWIGLLEEAIRDAQSKNN